MPLQAYNDNRGNPTHRNSTSNNGRPTPEYTAWQNIKRRCYSINGKDYPYYGGRGIKMSEEWKNSFESFLRDMGNRPSDKHSIDRKRNDGDYEKNNCRWATKKQQGRNKRSNVKMEYNGRKILVSAFAKKMGVNQSNISYFIKLGYTLPQIAYHYKNLVRKSKIKLNGTS